MIEQAKFAYSHLGKALERQAKRLKVKEKNKQKHLKSMENNELCLVVKIFFRTFKTKISF